MDFPQPSGAPEQPARPVEFQTYPTPADLARYAEGKVRRRLYRDLKLLGSGAEGKVKLSENVETGELVALKSMAKPSMPALGMNMETLTDSMKAKLQVREKAEREIRRRYLVMESHNGHPHLPLYLDFFETSSKWYIVSRICSGGDLLSYIQRTGRPTLLENDARLVVKILLETLAYLHHHEVVHRDLKPVNILLRDPNNLASLCLVDFGSSFVTHVKESPDLWGGMPTTPIEFPTSPGSSTDLSSGEAIVDLVVGDGPDMKTLTGTPFYLAPEIVSGLRYTSRVDVWALGCITFQLLYGRTPFQDAASFADLFARICRAEFVFPRVYPQPSAEAESFIRFILEVEPGKRPNAQDALRHPWIAGVDAMHGRHRSGVGVQFDHGELRVAQNEMAALETE